MLQNPATISKALNDLFSTYPSFRPADPVAAMKVYFEAVSEYHQADVLDAVHAFITGSVPGHNPSFAPSAPEVGSACRRAMFKRLDAERLDKLALPAPPDDFEQDPLDVRIRNKAKLDALAASLASTMDMDRAPLRDLQRRTNAYFDTPLGYSVGDPDAEAGDMGGRKAS